MYDELVRRLRDSEHEIDCSICDRDCCYPDGKVHGKCIIIEASDAIEELSVVVRVQKAMIEKFPSWIPVTERLPEPYKRDAQGRRCPYQRGGSMTLDEAILHAKQKADENEKSAKYMKKKYGDHVIGYSIHCKCAEEHRQLAEWLEELQQRRKNDLD